MDDTLLEDLINQQDLPQSEAYHPLDPLHPLHQDVWEHPEKYVVVVKDVWNRLLEIAHRNMEIQQVRSQGIVVHAQPEWITCRYDGCRQQFTGKGAKSNRKRHEEKQHQYIHQEDGHEH